MTWERRAEIFSRDVISTDDLAELLGLCRASASTLMATIRRTSKRTPVKGLCYVEDYIDFFKFSPERYVFNKQIVIEGDTMKKNPWTMAAKYIHGRVYFRVYRLKDHDEADVEHNREYANDWTLERCTCRALMEKLNATGAGSEILG